jgi:hypothetical protein
MLKNHGEVNLMCIFDEISVGFSCALVICVSILNSITSTFSFAYFCFKHSLGLIGIESFYVCNPHICLNNQAVSICLGCGYE